MQPLILSLLRKGGLDIPAMFLINSHFGINCIAWATPVADFLAMVVAILVFFPFWRKLNLELKIKSEAEMGKNFNYE